MKKFIKSILSESNFNKAKNLYKDNITNFKRDIYSEFGEDFIAAVLLGFKQNGFYVDIGAFQPKELSVTYYFYKKLSWSGITIEPNPAAAIKFLTQRPRDIFLNMGVADTKGELTYHEFTDPTLNSFSEAVYEQNKSTFIKKRSIEVNRLDEILSKNVPAGTSIDLMNIDVEGLDMKVLKSNDWKNFSPNILIIEDHKFNPESPLKSEIVQYIKEQGYTLKANCLISLVFQKNT